MISFENCKLEKIARKRRSQDRYVIKEGTVLEIYHRGITTPGLTEIYAKRTEPTKVQGIID